MTTRRLQIVAIVALLAALATFGVVLAKGQPAPSVAPGLVAAGTGFTYQGRLDDDGTPASGPYDFEFRLFDDLAAGALVAGPISAEDIPVADGLFSARLDFGAGVFNGDARFLEVAVRQGARTDAYTALKPRQELTPTPYAIHSQSASIAPWSGLTGVPAGFADGVDDDTFTGLYNVANFGALGNGRDDDTAAFQAAIDAAATNGGMVFVPLVGPGKGYVLTGTVHLKAGVALIGSLSGFTNNGWAAFALPDSIVKGAKIFARPSELRKPLFQLDGGTTVRGFWILYDEQPMPSDEEFQDPTSPFHYPSFEEAKSNFITDHVKTYGPTFYLPDNASHVVIEDIMASQYYDFFFLRSGAKLTVNRISLYGYNSAFVIQESFDVNVISNVHYVPNVGPTCPCKVGYLGKSWTWIYDIIVSRPSNVGIHLGVSDGYILDNVSFIMVHTALRFGSSTDFPIYDPVEDTSWTNPPATGPWGQMSNIQIDQAAVGFHFVWPNTLGNRISNALVFPSFDDGSDFPATTGTGSFPNVGREAAFLFESTFGRSNNFSFVPTILANNITIDSFQDTARFPRAAARLWDANGRVFLIGGDVTMEISGFSLNFGNEDVMVASAPTAGDVSIRLRGYVRGGDPDVDKKLDKNGIAPLP